jgi:hypothetical protein
VLAVIVPVCTPPPHTHTHTHTHTQVFPQFLDPESQKPGPIFTSYMPANSTAKLCLVGMLAGCYIRSVRACVHVRACVCVYPVTLLCLICVVAKLCICLLACNERVSQFFAWCVSILAADNCWLASLQPESG